MLLVLSAALALATVEPAAAAPAPAAPSEAAAAQTELKPGERKIKVVCKSVAPTGTRFAKRKCVEASAYARQQEIDRRAFEETQNRAVVNTARSN